MAAGMLADPLPPRSPRDLSTVLLRLGRLSVVLEPRAWLIGPYVAPGAVYGWLLCVAVRWERKPKAAQGGAERPAEWMPGRRG